MEFADIHTHILAGVDDGPEENSQMYAMVDACYRDGTKFICCTPHYHPGYYGHNVIPSAKAFQFLSEYVKSRYPDLQIFPGNELHYSQGCLEWLEDGLCRTVNGTRYVLVDFEYDVRYQMIEFAVLSFLRHGYIPVLAHVERYEALKKKYKLVMRLHELGAIIQVNAMSVLQTHRYPLVKKILQQRIVDVVASDCHNLTVRPPVMSASYTEVAHKFGKDYADAVFLHNPCSILNVQNIREKIENE